MFQFLIVHFYIVLSISNFLTALDIPLGEEEAEQPELSEGEEEN